MTLRQSTRAGNKKRASDHFNDCGFHALLHLVRSQAFDFSIEDVPDNAQTYVTLFPLHNVRYISVTSNTVQDALQEMLTTTHLSSSRAPGTLMISSSAARCTASAASRSTSTR